VNKFWFCVTLICRRFLLLSSNLFSSHYTALPVITTHPNNNGPIIVAEGSDVVLRCEATGEGTLNYQWRRLSGSLPDSNTTTFTVSNLTVSDSGGYYCIVDNGGTRVPSIKVEVTVKGKYSIVIMSKIPIIYEMISKAHYNEQASKSRSKYC